MDAAANLVILVAAVITALGIIAKSPPARWLWRTVVRDPWTEALRNVVAEVVDEALSKRPVTNGWGKDAIASIAEKVGADVPPPKSNPDA